jgi:hypothetical protein
MEFALQMRKKHGKTCQGKKNLSQVKKILRVQYTYYQNTHTLQNNVVGNVVAGHTPATTQPTTLHICKTRGC